MGGISYRELVAWQKGIALVKLVYALTRSWPREELYTLTSQIRRAAISVPSNVAEGQGLKTAKHFLHHLAIAYGSLMEVETQLQLGFELGYIQREQLDSAIGFTNELGRIINGLRQSIARR
jgi:four helix bundle protein